MAYRSVLGAFEDKDLDFLKEVCERQLIKHLNIPKKIKLINQREKVHVKIKKLKYCFGLPLDRDLYPK